MQNILYMRKEAYYCLIVVVACFLFLLTPGLIKHGNGKGILPTITHGEKDAERFVIQETLSGPF